MFLSPQDMDLIFKLQRAVYFDINQRLKVFPGEYTTLKDAKLQTPEKRIRMREALLANKQLLDSFASDNPFELSGEELDIVRSWHHAFIGKFCILRILNKHAIFLTGDDDLKAYGESALSQPFEEQEDICASNGRQSNKTQVSIRVYPSSYIMHLDSFL